MSEDLKQNISPEQNLDTQKEESKNDAPSSVPEESSTETQEQINWKKFREQREKDRQAAREAERRAQEKEAETEAIKKAMEQLLQEKNSPKTPVEDDYFQTEEERLNKIVEQKLKERYQEEEDRRREAALKETPQRLRREHPDFDQVCSADNLDYLEFHHPEISTPYASMPDSFEKWNMIYKAVKKYVPVHNHKEMQQRAEHNMAKPQSMSVPGRTATTDTIPTYLDEDRKAANWQRMCRILKNG